MVGRSAEISDAFLALVLGWFTRFCGANLAEAPAMVRRAGDSRSLRQETGRPRAQQSHRKRRRRFPLP